MLDKDTVEQYVIEHMTFDGDKIPEAIVHEWIDEMFFDLDIEDKQENRKQAIKEIEPVLLNYGYVPAKEGYERTVSLE